MKLLTTAVVSVSLATLAAVAVRRWMASSKKRAIKTNAVVTDIIYYPVKSFRGIRVTEAEVGLFGFENDRKWMVVDNGRFVTQRQIPKMALCVPSFADNCLVISAPDAEPLKIPLDRSGPISTVTVWSYTGEAVDQGDDAADWLRTVLGRDGLRLVKLREGHDRVVDPDFTGSQGDDYLTGFADGYPFLVISEESLAELNTKYAADAQLPMTRFRPNIVVRGVAAPFEEDQWKEIQIGPIVFRGVKKCPRCKQTTVDPARGEFTGPEPLQTLKSFRTDAAVDPKCNQVFFGMNLISEQKAGRVHVGDAISVFV
eukprot:TRINITY_DN9892_c0_g1_i2.p1 TRINITY_DN9892_c0_g1~~TRINITY_DN9892_c0_g1_i2.p1  ORF type:complete len:321 (+),score=83.00 TRINITY_DN9892_c0_g1_i2:25-963(+)